MEKEILENQIKDIVKYTLRKHLDQNQTWAAKITIEKEKELAERTFDLSTSSIIFLLVHLKTLLPDS